MTRGRNTATDALVFAPAHPYCALVGTNRHLIVRTFAEKYAA